jgi:hypothetical protein
MNTIEHQRHSGMFKPGQSGNPSGRPKEDKTIRDLARAHTADAIETLISIAKNPKASDSARVQASTALLDRAWGKPTQYNENHNTGESYADFILKIAYAEEEEIFDIDVAENKSEMDELLNS